jgi:phenylpropionate dioxygenase-like ring-hydroxylating dioxygenase large terminal subunit
MSDVATQHTIPPQIPNGWFAVAFSKDLIAGEVKRIRYFGEELVLFRTRSGQAHVLDAYCAHLGAHLGEGGKVMGECVRCPFHFWHYDGTGECVKIPYAQKIPPKARVRAWQVVERDRMIFVWHHAEGGSPYWDVPEMPELENPEWTEPRYWQFDVNVHMQDMAENNCDPVHFMYVHGMEDIPESQVSYAENGRLMHMESQSERVTPLGTFQVNLHRDTWGLGLAAVRMVGIADAGLLMFSSTSPVDRTHTTSRWIFTVSKNLADLAGEEFIENMSTGVLDDMRIWENKIYRANPVLCDGDKFLGHFRHWAKQFYSNGA